MSLYAFTNPDHKPEHHVFASDINSEKERNAIYYCPGCNAKFKYRAQSSNMKEAHFFKLPSETHDADCWVKYIESTKCEFSASSTAGFSCQAFFDLITTPRKRSSSASKKDVNDSRVSTNTLLLNSVRNLYIFCQMYPDSTKINDSVSVRDVFVGRKTSYLYTTFVSGYKLIEAEYHHYDKNKLTIYFTVPYQRVTKFKIAVKIKNLSLFKTIVHRVYKNTEPVLLYGEWHTCEVKISGEVISSRQVVAL
jgi:hypothetical protein